MNRAIIIAALPLLGCNHGIRPEKFEPAQSPVGAEVAVRVAGETEDRVGELYSADSTGLIVKPLGRLIRVAWRRIEALDVDKMGHAYDIVPGEVIDEKKIRRLAAVSRFPQGLQGDLLGRVLKHLYQDSLEVIANRNLDSVIDVALSASARFADRRVAMLEGYRRVGADFPSMGEHWIHHAALLAGGVDPLRPTFLSYATIDGQPRLLGFGFIFTTGAVPLRVELPGWPEAWHEHSGLLAEESARPVGVGTGTKGTRVWVLHVWAPMENPDGRFAADNWAIPFVRAGLASPSKVDADAGRALSLAVGGDDFLKETLTVAGLRTVGTAVSSDSIIASARAKVANIRVRASRAQSMSGADLIELRGIWQELRTALGRELGDNVIPLLEPPHPVHRANSGTGKAHHASH
jgi:hypothetical protein